MKRDQQFANIRRIYGPEKEAPGVLAIEVELVAELSTAPTGRTVTPIRTAGGGNPAVLSPLSPLTVLLLLKPRLGERSQVPAEQLQQQAADTDSGPQHRAERQRAQAGAAHVADPRG